MEFESQICTTKEQSERLIALGLKKETGDMYITNMSSKGINYTDDWKIGSISYCKAMSVWNSLGLKPEKTSWSVIPAWSLHRLIEMMPNAFQDEQYRNFVLKVNSQEVSYVYNYVDDEGYGQSDSIDVDDNFYNLYDGIIAHIKWLIKKGLLNECYLAK